MNISNAASHSRSAANSAGNDNSALPQPAARQPTANGSQRPSDAQAARTADLARNRLFSTLPVALRPELRRCLDAARREPTSANAFISLGNVMTAAERFDVTGVWMTQQQCFRKAVELDPSNATAFYNLGTTLSANESIDVNGAAMTKQQCYRKAVELDSRNANAFYGLGNTLSAGGSLDVNGVEMTQQQCFRKAAELDPSNATAFYNLGTTLSANESIDVNSVAMTKQQCYRKAAELDPSYTQAFYNLGTTLSASGSIDVNGVAMTQQQCYRKAAELDPSYSFAFNNLGNTLSASGSIDVNGVAMTKQQCHRKAVELDPRNAPGFLNLGMTLGTSASIDVNGVVMTQQQCYCKAVELDSRNANAFVALGTTLSASGSLDVNGVVMTQQQCYCKAAELDTRMANAFYNLGTTLSASESIDVNGVVMTQQQCYCKAAELDPRMANAFYNLGTTLSASGSIEVNGVLMSKRDCYRKALEIEPGNTFAQSELRRLDQAEAAITGANPNINLLNRNCAAEALQRHPAHSNRVDQSSVAAMVPLPNVAQHGSGLAGSSGRAALAAASTEHGAGAHEEVADLPLSTAELAEAMRLQQQHDARRSSAAAAAAIAPSALPLPSELSRLSLSHAPPHLTHLSASIAAPAASIRQDWTFAETEEHAERFNLFQARLDETGDYMDSRLRPDLIARVNALVADMRESPALRRTCFAIADGAISTCGDAITLGLNQMALEKISHDAQAGGDDLEQLRALGEGFYKLHVLNELVNTEITRRRGAGVSMDEVEIRLAYQVALRTRLDLPGVAHSMLYVRSAHVTQAAIDAAATEVERRLQGSASVDFLVQWAPWQRAMERAHPQAYAAARSMHREEREALTLQPPRTSEGEWLGAFPAQAAQEIADIQRITKRLTWTILESN